MRSLVNNNNQAIFNKMNEKFTQNLENKLQLKLLNMRSQINDDICEMSSEESNDSIEGK